MEKGRIEFTDPNFRANEIDRWAVGQALNDLHFQKDSVRKCAAVNNLLERVERDRFGELEYFRSLLATLEAGDTALAIESVQGAIRVLEK
jgi:hypothetical protein